MQIGFSLSPAAPFGILSGLLPSTIVGSLTHLFDLRGDDGGARFLPQGTARFEVVAPAGFAGAYEIALSDLADGPRMLRAPAIIDAGDGSLTLRGGLYAHDISAESPSVRLDLERDGRVIATDADSHALGEADAGRVLTLRETVTIGGRSIEAVATFAVDDAEDGPAPDPVTVAVTRLPSTAGLAGLVEGATVEQVLSAWTGRPVATVSDGSEPRYDHAVLIDGIPLSDPARILGAGEQFVIATTIGAPGADDLVVATDAVTIPAAPVDLPEMVLANLLDGTLDFDFTGEAELTVEEPEAYAGTYTLNRDDMGAGLLEIVAPAVSHDTSPQAGATLTARSGLILYDPDFGLPVRTLTWRVDGTGATDGTGETFAAVPGRIVLRETWTNAAGSLVIDSAPVTVAAPPVEPDTAAIAILAAPTRTDGITVTADGEDAIFTPVKQYGAEVRWAGPEDFIEAGSAYEASVDVTVPGSGGMSLFFLVSETAGAGAAEEIRTNDTHGSFTQTISFAGSDVGATPHFGFSTRNLLNVDIRVANMIIRKVS